MNFQFSRHAREEMERRQIPLALVESILADPQQVISGPTGRKVYQSEHHFGVRIFLVRVIVDDSFEPATVVTVYRTSKIGKYWRKP
ncbi:MAG: DUF4258 domain-containing protein [Acidobacteria bacterium]|nr:DUF4258 domain-containing protein [Acidobacteriota bacterium]